ncbi:MAG: histidinol-phosphatase [Spirochaetota bacterium]
MKNYHTHTYRCKHAIGDVADYAQEAVKQGITVLGMSDHTPLPDDRWPSVRMHLSELEGYVAAIDSAQKKFLGIKVLKGMECEFAPEYVNFYQEILLDKYSFDYLIGAPHFVPGIEGWKNSYGGVKSPRDLRAYSNYMIDTMRSGLFAFIAHPDLFGNSYLEWDENTIACSRDIFSAAEELHIPLEINGYGLRKPKIDTPNGQRRMYPLLPFWELARDYDIQVIVNSDAHKPKDVAANMGEAIQIAESNDLLVTELGYL